MIGPVTGPGIGLLVGPVAGLNITLRDDRPGDVLGAAGWAARSWDGSVHRSLLGCRPGESAGNVPIIEADPWPEPAPSGPVSIPDSTAPHTFARS
ncbi:hypothetical protein SXIM_39410 [Streptomyces xiamenensis]|uniref:Uncharacterized protein n=1 Tax=Streptomyces xiamenensis TaxID=408015 RepID=A0A0F7FZ00_9ACTN|nr:hypothetical protein SXIM_39410 [Streptomyces xiamenensis]